MSELTTDALLYRAFEKRLVEKTASNIKSIDLYSGQYDDAERGNNLWNESAAFIEWVLAPLLDLQQSHLRGRQALHEVR